MWLVITWFMSSQAACCSCFFSSSFFIQAESKSSERTCALLVTDHSCGKSASSLASSYLTTAGVTHSFLQAWTCRISRYRVWTKRKSVLILGLQNCIHSMTQIYFVLFFSFNVPWWNGFEDTDLLRWIFDSTETDACEPKITFLETDELPSAQNTLENSLD